MKTGMVIFSLLAFFVAEIDAKNDVMVNPPLNPHEVFILPGSAQQVPKNLLEYKLSTDSNAAPGIRLKTAHNDSKKFAVNLRDDLLWTLTHVDENAEYYLGSGAANDTFVVVFTPADIGIVSEVYMQWYTPGTFRAFAADYSDSAQTISPDGECSSIDSGAFLGSPIGTHRTPITLNTVDGYVADWSYRVDIGGTFITADSSDLSISSFVIALIKDDVDPKPLADATDDQGGLTYTWFGGPWTNNIWRRYSAQVELMMLVKIIYPFGRHAPTVEYLSELSNTYNDEGPYTVFAWLYGLGGISESDSIVFHWVTNNIQTNGELVAYEVDEQANGLYRYDISGDFTVGDEIEYWVSSYGVVPNETIHLSFEIKEPEHPDADLLIIADGASDEQEAADLYRRVVDELGIEYEFWDTSIEKGIDASVINAGWSNIIVYGWTTEIVPVIAGEDDPGFADFLDAGGSLVLADQDLFFGHGLAHDLTFEPGDFAYDYFGLSGATNDPFDEEENASGDTLFYGVGGTFIDDDFVNDPLVLNHTLYGTANWADPLIPGNATALFVGAHDSLIYATAYDNNIFSTAFFAFMPDAAVSELPNDEIAYEQFETLLNGIIQWLGILTDIEKVPSIPMKADLVGAYPNPFNPSTTIRYGLPEESNVALVIYDIRGNIIQTLSSGHQSAGWYDVTWNGETVDGKSISTGIYFARLFAGDYSQVVKMLYLK